MRLSMCDKGINKKRVMGEKGTLFCLVMTSRGEKWVWQSRMRISSAVDRMQVGSRETAPMMSELDGESEDDLIFVHAKGL